MLTLSSQQVERLTALMISGGFQSTEELIDEMLSNFEYQQRLRALRKQIYKGLNSGEPQTINDLPAFFEQLKARANK